MLAFVLVGLTCAAVGIAAARLFWPRIVTVEVERRVEVPTPKPLPYEKRRFHVVFATDHGAEARRLYERVTPSADGVVDFFDGGQWRSGKEASHGE